MVFRTSRVVPGWGHLTPFDALGGHATPARAFMFLWPFLVAFAAGHTGGQRPGRKMRAFYIGIALFAVTGCARELGVQNQQHNLANAPLQVLAPPPASTLVDSPPISINSQTGIVVRGLKITSQAGPCVTISNSSDIVVDGSDLGPCGGNAVAIKKSAAVKIVNSSIHTERDGAGTGDSGLGILIKNSSDVLVQGNEFAYNESSVYALDSSDVRVIGNFSLNPLGPVPRGQHVQFNHVQGGLIGDNYGIASSDTTTYRLAAHKEDAINLFYAASVEVRANYLVGGTSPSGCGIIADGSGTANTIVDNVVIRTAQCGIGIAGGTNHIIAGNKVLDTNIPDGRGNVGIYVWNLYAGPCSGHSVTGNAVSNLWPNGYSNDYWDGQNCGPVDLRDNILGSDARALLTPESDRLPPPPIPPKPYVP